MIPLILIQVSSEDRDVLFATEIANAVIWGDLRGRIDLLVATEATENGCTVKTKSRPMTVTGELRL